MLYFKDSYLDQGTNSFTDQLSQTASSSSNIVTTLKPSLFWKFNDAAAPYQTALLKLRQNMVTYSPSMLFNWAYPHQEYFDVQQGEPMILSGQFKYYDIEDNLRTSVIIEASLESV